VRVSDADLREMERRFRETGSVEDEAAWLLERVRAGELEQNRLDLAACLGHEASGGGAPASEDAPNHLEMLKALRLAGTETVARAAVGAARRVLHYWTEAYPTDTRPESAIEAAENWILCQCQTHLDRAEQAALDVPRMVGSGGAALRPGWAARTAFYTALIGAGRAGEAVSEALETGLSSEEVCQVVGRELIPWALGYSDPVRERVEARQREAAGE